METKVEITRKQIIVVGEIKGMVGEKYPKWVFTDKEGKEYKVNPKRTQYFEDVKPGIAAEISFAAYQGTEYPYCATAVADKLPTKTEPPPSVLGLIAEQMAEGDPPKQTMTPSAWAEKDRITRKSIERQKSLELAVNLCIAEKIAIAKVGEYATRFEAYLDGSEPAKVKNQLVEEALRLGAITEGEDPQG